MASRFPSLALNDRAILKGEPHIIRFVNGSEIYKAVPKPLVELSYQTGLPQQYARTTNEIAELYKRTGEPVYQACYISKKSCLKRPEAIDGSYSSKIE